MKRTLNLVAVRGQATAASLKARSRSSRGNKKAGSGRQGGYEDEQEAASLYAKLGSGPLAPVERTIFTGSMINTLVHFRR